MHCFGVRVIILQARCHYSVSGTPYTEVQISGVAVRLKDFKQLSMFSLWPLRTKTYAHRYPRFCVVGQEMFKWCVLMSVFSGAPLGTNNVQSI